MRDFEEYREIIKNYYENKHFYNYKDLNVLENPKFMEKLHLSKETNLFIEYIKSDERLMYFEFLSDVIEYDTKKVKQEREKSQIQSNTKSDEAKKSEADRLQQTVTKILSEKSTSIQLSSSNVEGRMPVRVEQTPLPTIPEEMVHENLRLPEVLQVQAQDSNISTGLSLQSKSAVSIPESQRREIVRGQELTSTPLLSHDQQRLQIPEPNIDSIQILTSPQMNTNDPILNEFRQVIASCDERNFDIDHENYFPSYRPVTKKRTNCEKFYFYKMTEPKLEQVNDWSDYKNYICHDHSMENLINFFDEHVKINLEDIEVARNACSKTRDLSHSQPTQNTPGSIYSDREQQQKSSDFSSQRELRQYESVLQKSQTPKLDFRITGNLSQQQQQQEQERHYELNVVEEIPEVIPFDRHARSLTDKEIENILAQEEAEENVEEQNDLIDAIDQQQQRPLSRPDFETDRNWREILRSHSPFTNQNVVGRVRRKRRRQRRRIINEDDGNEEVIPRRRRRNPAQPEEIPQPRQELIVSEQQPPVLEQNEFIPEGLITAVERNAQQIEPFETENNLYLDQTSFQTEYNKWKKSTFEDLSLNNVKRYMYSTKFDTQLLNVSLNREYFNLIKLLIENKFLEKNEIFPQNLNKISAIMRFKIILEMNTQNLITVNKDENGEIIKITIMQNEEEN